jgi:hypothetical protein
LLPHDLQVTVQSRQLAPQQSSVFATQVAPFW